MRYRRRMILLGSVFAISASLLSAKPPKEWKQPTWKVAKTQFNIVTAVDAGTGTVSISHVGGKIKQEQHLKVSAFSEILVDGKKTTLAAIKVGMHVAYTLGMDGGTIARLEDVVELAPPPTPVATATPSFPHPKK